MLYAIKHALRSIRRRKLKNLINTLGILIGVSLLAGVQIATDSLVNAMKETVSLRYGDADIVIQKGFYQPEFFNYTLFQDLQNDSELAPFIDGISPRITAQVMVTSFFTTKQTEPFVTIVGVNETLDAAFGEFISNENYGNNEFNFTELGEIQCIIGDRLAESVIDFDIEGQGKNQKKSLKENVPNPIEITYLDAQGNYKLGQSLNVKGIFKTSGKGVLNSGYTIFMKLNHLQELYNTTNNEINSIIISTTQGNDNAMFVKNLLELRLIHYLGEDGKKFTVDPQKYEAFKDVESSIKDFRVVLYIFGSLIIISGVMLILNITLMNIDERQRSIGILRAIGMTKKQLLISLLTESMVMGGIGSALGLAGGIVNGLGIIFLLENFLDIGEILTQIPLLIKPIGLITSFAIGLLISFLAAIYPAWRASKINLVEVINEIETPQVRQKSGNWSILLGAILILGAIGMIIISQIITLESRWTICLGGILAFLFGLGFLFARIIGARISFNAFAISWMVAGLLSVVLFNPYLNRIGVEDKWTLYTFLIGMLALVFGTIIFVALNLEWISNRFNDVFQRFKNTRAIGSISMRYIGKKKTRSALTFAIFGVILTMNVFLAVFTGSFTLGFDNFIIREEGGVDIIAYSPFTTSNYTLNPKQIIENADDRINKVVGMKFKFSLFGSLTYLKFTAINSTGTTTEILPIPTDMWGINNEFLEMTEYKFESVWDEIDDDPWIAANNSDNKYVIFPSLLQEFSFDEGGTLFNLNLTLGDSVPISEYNNLTGEYVLANYTIIAFIDTASYSVLFANFLFTSQESAIFGEVSDFNAFLIQTNPRLTMDKNVEISRKVEAELLGFDTLCIEERLERFMELIVQSVSFMQAFVSLGLVVGVLGLIIVSLRGITERTREIGMMRALGFKRVEVITAVVIEIFAVAFVGLIIGFVNGFLLGYGMYTQYLVQYDFRFIVPWTILAIFIIATILLSIIAAVLPARRAAKIPPSDALRYVG